MPRTLATAAAALLLCGTLASTAEARGFRHNKTWGAMPNAPEPKYPATKKCDPTRCICTPQAFVDAFLRTPNLSGNSTSQNPNLNSTTMPFPLCVGENLVGRVNSNNVPPVTTTITPLGAKFQARRRFVFVFDNRALETILGLGQFRAKRILELVGFGALPNFQCNPPARQELLVYSLKSTATPAGCKRKNPNDVNSNLPNNCNRAPLMPAYWDNVLPWLEQNYKRDLSFLEPAIQTLKTTRFQDLTGCDPLEIAKLTTAEVNNGAILQSKAGCSPEFGHAVDVLQAGICYRGTDEQVAQFPKNYLFYAEGKRGVKQNYCDSDTYLFNLGPNDAVELRAFLFSTQAFNGFYTGYGFTANFYQEPMAPEFWVNNALFSKIDYAHVQLDCTKSSNPIEQQAAAAAMAQEVTYYFTPTLAS